MSQSLISAVLKIDALSFVPQTGDHTILNSHKLCGRDMRRPSAKALVWTWTRSARNECTTDKSRDALIAN